MRRRPARKTGRRSRPPTTAHPQNVSDRGVRVRALSRSELVGVVVGSALTVVGLLLVTDLMSLREVLARTGQESALRLAREMHLSLEHAGAQIVELSGALIGMALVAFSIRGLLRNRPVARLPRRTR